MMFGKNCSALTIAKQALPTQHVLQTHNALHAEPFTANGFSPWTTTRPRRFAVLTKTKVQCKRLTVWDLFKVFGIDYSIGYSSVSCHLSRVTSVFIWGLVSDLFKIYLLGVHSGFKWCSFWTLYVSDLLKNINGLVLCSLKCKIQILNENESI